MEILVQFMLAGVGLTFILLVYDYKKRFAHRASSTLFFPLRFKQKIFLTFDDGPACKEAPWGDDANSSNQGATTTEKYLACLRNKKILGIFFVQGRNLENQKGKEVFSKILSAGHGIGNHGHDHQDSLKIAPECLEQQIKGAEKIMKELGADPVAFRPPYGSWSGQLSDLHGILPAMWSHDSRDWDLANKHDARKEMDVFCQTVITASKTQGCIVLMHDVWGVGLELIEMLDAYRMKEVNISWGTPEEFSQEVKRASKLYFGSRIIYYLSFRFHQLLSMLKGLRYLRGAFWMF